MEHKTERRPREISESYCVEEGCEYFLQPAVQGHCFSQLDDNVNQYIAKVERKSEESLKEIRAASKNQEDYIKDLESYYVCAFMNWSFVLDEVIKLRKRIAEFERNKKE